MSCASHAPSMPNFARPGDVNDVGTKLVQRTIHERQVAQESHVEAQILVERKGKKAALQL